MSKLEKKPPIPEPVSEIHENKKIIRRLNRSLLQSFKQTETLTVQARDGQEYDLEIHPVVEVSLVELAEKRGLDIVEMARQLCSGLKPKQCSEPVFWIIRKNGEETFYCNTHKPAEAERFKDPKAAAKMRFIDECIAAALNETPDLKLTAEDVAELLPTHERSRIFKKVMDVSNQSRHPVNPLEKFR